MDTSIDLDTPLVPPTLVAYRKGVSVEAVEQAAKKLGVEYARNPTGRRLMSLRDAQKLSKHFDARGNSAVTLFFFSKCATPRIDIDSMNESRLHTFRAKWVCYYAQIIVP